MAKDDVEVQWQDDYADSSLPTSFRKHYPDATKSRIMLCCAGRSCGSLDSCDFHILVVTARKMRSSVKVGSTPLKTHSPALYT